MIRDLAVIFLLSLFIYFPLQGKAQYSLVALQDSIQTTRDPVRKAGFLLSLSNNLLSRDAESAEGYALSALESIEEEREEYKLKGGINLFLGKIYFRSGEFVRAREFAEEAQFEYELLMRKNPHFETKVAEAMFLLGKIFLRQGNYLLASNRFSQALEIRRQLFEKHGIENGADLLESLTAVGEMNHEFGDMEEAYEYYNQAYDRQLAAPHQITAATAYLYDKLFEYHLERGESDLANAYLESQKRVEKMLKNPYNDQLISFNQARLESLLGKKEQSLKNLFLLLDRLSQQANPYLSIEVRYEIGQQFFEDKNYKKAFLQFSEGLESAKKLDARMMVLNGNGYLSKLYEAQRDWANSLAYRNEYLSIQNEMLIEMARMGPIANNTRWFQEQNKNNQGKIKELEERLGDHNETIRLRYNLALAVLFILTVLGVISFFLYTYNKRNNLILEEKNKTINDTMLRLEETVEELEKSRKQLKETNQVQNKLMTVISHDLRGQFGGMEQFALIMKNDLDNLSREDLKKFAGHFYDNAKKLNYLFENLIQWARTQIGEVVFKGGEHDLADIIRDNIALQENQAADKSIKLHARVPEKLKVYTDANMLNFILRNLIANGLKFTYKGGWVIVDAEEKIPGFVRISVVDNGMGMTEKVAASLFDMGSGYSQEGTSREKGTGIGLALCAEFAQKMGTRLEVNSLKGQGTSISFVLPIAESEKMEVKTNY